MSEDSIVNAYFEWMFDIVCGEQRPKEISHRKLLMHLHDTEFVPSHPRDENRAIDGIDLRYRFAYEHAGIEDAESYLTGPCSVLEMMVALTIYIEESIMDDPTKGNRTRQWFWGMINSLGLSSMTDDRFDKARFEESMDTFMNRRYAPNGKGGLFTVKNCDKDLRTVEIWYQLCWYLNTFV